LSEGHLFLFGCGFAAVRTGILFLIDEIHEVIQQPEQRTKEQKLVN
jgi:hypothetical protein